MNAALLDGSAETTLLDSAADNGNDVGAGDDEPDWLAQAPTLLHIADDAPEASNADEADAASDDEPSWLAQAHDDAFTGETLLETLRVLDQETDVLSDQLSHVPPPTEEEEPEWLSQAAETAKTISDLEPRWDETAAIAQGGLLTATEEAAGLSSTADAGALRWLDAQLLELVARSFPHLERLVSSPSLVSEDRETLARELLRKRDVLMLRERQSSAYAALPVAVRTMSTELRRDEASLHETRRAAAKQNRGYATLYQQLELTRSAAAATSSAARTIVDDHENDVGVLLQELAKHAPAEACAAVSKKLSASLHQLQARKRRAQMEAAEAKAGRRAEKRAERANSSGGGGSGSIISAPLGRARVLSFGRRASNNGNSSKPKGSPANGEPPADDDQDSGPPAAPAERRSGAAVLGVGRAGLRALSFSKRGGAAGSREVTSGSSSSAPATRQEDEFIVVDN